MYCISERIRFYRNWSKGLDRQEWSSHHPTKWWCFSRGRRQDGLGWRAGLSIFTKRSILIPKALPSIFAMLNRRLQLLGIIWNYEAQTCLLIWHVHEIIVAKLFLTLSICSWDDMQDKGGNSQAVANHIQAVSLYQRPRSGSDLQRCAVCWLRLLFVKNLTLRRCTCDWHDWSISGTKWFHLEAVEPLFGKRMSKR